MSALLDLSDYPTPTPSSDADEPAVASKTERVADGNVNHALADLLITVQRLHDADVAAEFAFREGQYARAVPTYAQGQALERDPELCRAFFSAAVWSTHEGERPNVLVHGVADAMRFMIMSVHGGGRARNQTASMMARGLVSLNKRGISPEALVEEIRKKRGPKRESGWKALAALHAQEKAASPTGREQVDAEADATEPAEEPVHASSEPDDHDPQSAVLSDGPTSDSIEQGANGAAEKVAAAAPKLGVANADVVVTSNAIETTAASPSDTVNLEMAGPDWVEFVVKASPMMAKRLAKTELFLMDGDGVLRLSIRPDEYMPVAA